MSNVECALTDSNHKQSPGIVFNIVKPIEFKSIWVSRTATPCMS